MNVIIESYIEVEDTTEVDSLAKAQRLVNGLYELNTVDDSIIKQGKLIENYLVISSKEIPKQNYDAIIITSFSYRKEILHNIKDLDINKPVMMFGTTDFKISNFLRYQ